MSLLFNKSNNGAEEIRNLTSSYYANNKYSKIETQIILEEEAMTRLVGGDLMARAASHYKSGNFDASEPNAENLKNDTLVKYLQRPIAYRATHRYYQLNLVSHEDTGRKVKIDADNEKLAWEWMIDKDDIAQVRVGNETADLLFRWLDANKIAEWMNSPSRKSARKLFVNTAEIFHEGYPIDLSPGFFYTSLAWNDEVQRITIKKALGTHYPILLNRWVNEGLDSGSGSGSGGGVPGDDSMDEFYEDLLLLVQKVIPVMTMAKAVKRLSLQAMPYGVVQQFKSAIQSRSASQPVMTEVVHKQSMVLQAEAKYQLDDIKLHIKSGDPSSRQYPLKPKNDSTRKFFRT